jgi:hypothetical protein
MMLHVPVPLGLVVDLGLQPARLAQVTPAQQCVHLQCRILRDVRAFFWLRALSALKPASCPPTGRYSKQYEAGGFQFRTIADALMPADDVVLLLQRPARDEVAI